MEDKSLIGDITPKMVSAEEAAIASSTGTGTAAAGAMDVDDSAPQNAPTGTISASSWNHAGTWEERDLTAVAKDRLKSLCLEASVQLPALDWSNPASLSDAMDAMKDSLSGFGSATGVGGGAGDGAGAKLEQLSAAMSTVSARVTGASTVDGEAQIVMARGKKRFIFDFNVKLEFEIVVDSNLPSLDQATAEARDEKKIKKYKGVITVPEISPSVPIEPVLSFKKPLPASVEKRVKDAADRLKATVIGKIEEFEVEYKSF